MQSTFSLNADELNIDFLAGLKKLFAGKNVDITVCDRQESKEDETEYLLKNEETKNRLLESIAQGRAGIITTFDVDAL